MNKKGLYLIAGGLAVTGGALLYINQDETPPEAVEPAKLMRREGVGYSLTWEPTTPPYTIELECPLPSEEEPERRAITTILCPFPHYVWINLGPGTYKAVIKDGEGVKCHEEEFQPVAGCVAYTVQMHSGQRLFVSDDLVDWWMYENAGYRYQADPQELPRLFFKLESF